MLAPQLMSLHRKLSFRAIYICPALFQSGAGDTPVVVSFLETGPDRQTRRVSIKKDESFLRQLDNETFTHTDKESEPWQTSRKGPSYSAVLI